MKNIEIEDIDMGDYPDFCDAHISYAEHEDGTPYTEEELEAIPQDVVYEAVWETIH